MNVPRLPPGTIVAGKYTVQSELARGGTYATYAAIAAPGREIILRLMAPEAFDDAKAAAVRAVQMAADAVPEHLVARILELGRDPATAAPFIATARSAHPSLGELVEVCPFEAPEAMTVVSGIVRACIALHEHGLVHLAIHPRNVFVGPAPDRSVQLVDLCASLLRPAALPWAAPEQIEGGQTSPATDMYAIALLAFFALTGKSFLERKNDLRSPPSASRRADVVGVALPDKVDAVFARALAHAPGDRFATLDELNGALADALGQPKPEPALPPSLRMRVAAPAPAPPPAAEPAPAFVPPPPAWLDAPGAEAPPLPVSDSMLLSDGVAPLPPPSPVTSIAEMASLEAENAPPERRFPWRLVLAAVSPVIVLLVTIVLLLRTRGESDATTATTAGSASGSASAEPPAASASETAPPPEPSASASAHAEPEPEPASSASPDAPTIALKPQEGELDVQCEPKCSAIIIDGKPYRAFPKPAALRAGSHGVSVNVLGHGSQWKAVRVQAGKRNVLRFSLARGKKR